MANVSKRYKAVRAKVNRDKLYALNEALQLVKENATAKFNEGVDVALNLGIDAKKSDQNVRGSVVLPKGTGKTVRVAVFAQGEKAQQAKDAGADLVVTQLFYDVALYFQFVKDCRAAGITVPIIPGIMPIMTYGGFKRMTSFCKTKVPAEVAAAAAWLKVPSAEISRSPLPGSAGPVGTKDSLRSPRSPRSS
jgi:hypothetical protein